MDAISTAAQCDPDRQLLAQIEDFLAESGMKPTRFGIEAMAEGGLIASLQAGRSLSLKNANRVLAFMREWRLNNQHSEAGAAGKPDDLTAPDTSAEAA